MRKSTKIILSIGAILVLAVLILNLYVGYITPEIKLSESIPEVDKNREATVLTAFFGLDALPWISVVFSWSARGKDGMPVVFSQEIDPTTLDVSDFEFTTSAGNKYKPDVVTLLPANEEFELRTVLTIGEFGNHPDDPPVSLNIIGDLMSRSGQNYKGQDVEVIQLPDGPTLSYAEYFTFDEDYPYVEKGRGCDCPREETKMVVRTVWAGGVRAVNGDELGPNELDDFQVTMIKGSDTLVIKPYKLADLNDNDNYVDLCLKETGIPMLVEVNENVTIDPRGDKNPETKVEVVSRW